MSRDDAQILEVLRHGRALLNEPQRWTQGAFARDAHGGECAPWDGQAVCWCADGALQHKRCHDYLRIEARIMLEDVCNSGCLDAWNDSRHRSYADVIAAFDAAIARFA